jgi:hypothetical protein
MGNEAFTLPSSWHEKEIPSDVTCLEIRRILGNLLEAHASGGLGHPGSHLPVDGAGRHNPPVVLEHIQKRIGKQGMSRGTGVQHGLQAA